MALADSAVLVPGTGQVFIAPAGTSKPTDLTDPETPWEELGHTSIDDGVTIARDGGDSNILGTWQNPALRDRRDPVTFAVTATLLQSDNNSLALYFGGGDISEDGMFGVPAVSVPQDRAMYIRIIDGENELGIFLPRVAVASDDDVELDVENFMGYPIRATVLSETGTNLMEFFAPHLGVQDNEVQQIAITGSPTGGGFTLTFGGETTATIPYNATAAQVKSALVALSNVNAGDLSTSGGALPGTPVTVTFKGRYADSDVPALTSTDSFVGGGSSAVTTTTPGGS